MFSRAKAQQPSHSHTAEDTIAVCGMATQAWYAGDTSSLLDFCTDDIVFTHNAADKHHVVPFYGIYKGKQEFSKWIEEFGPKNIDITDIWFTEHQVSADNAVTRSAFVKYIVKATNIPVESVVRHRFTFENGKIKTISVVDDSFTTTAAFEGKHTHGSIPSNMRPGESKVGSSGDFVAQLGKATQAWKTGDIERLEAMISADHFESIVGTVANDTGCPWMGHFKGKEGFHKFMDGLRSSITIESVEFHEHRVHDNVVTRLAEFAFTVIETSKKCTMQWHERFVFDAHGKMERMFCVFDSEKVAQAFKK